MLANEINWTNKVSYKKFIQIAFVINTNWIKEGRELPRSLHIDVHGETRIEFQVSSSPARLCCPAAAGPATRTAVDGPRTYIDP